MNYVEVYKSVLYFHRKYSKAEDTEQYWKNVKGESERIAKQYDNHKFAVSLLLAVVSELERKAREARTDEQSGV